MSNNSEGVTLTILESFKFAHRGVEVREYTKGEKVETDDPELVTVATDNKWAKAEKAKGAAPENKDAASQKAENKGAES